MLEGEGVNFEADGRVSQESFLASLDPAIGTELKRPKKDEDLRATALELAQSRGPDKTC